MTSSHETTHTRVTVLSPTSIKLDDPVPGEEYTESTDAVMGPLCDMIAANCSRVHGKSRVLNLNPKSVLYNKEDAKTSDGNAWLFVLRYFGRMRVIICVLDLNSEAMTLSGRRPIVDRLRITCPKPGFLMTCAYLNEEDPRWVAEFAPREQWETIQDDLRIRCNASHYGGGAAKRSQMFKLKRRDGSAMYILLDLDDGFYKTLLMLITGADQVIKTDLISDCQSDYCDWSHPRWPDDVKGILDSALPLPKAVILQIIWGYAASPHESWTVDPRELCTPSVRSTYDLFDAVCARMGKATQWFPQSRRVTWVLLAEPLLGMYPILRNSVDGGGDVKVDDFVIEPNLPAKDPVAKVENTDTIGVLAAFTFVSGMDDDIQFPPSGVKFRGSKFLNGSNFICRLIVNGSVLPAIHSEPFLKDDV